MQWLALAVLVATLKQSSATDQPDVPCAGSIESCAWAGPADTALFQRHNSAVRAIDPAGDLSWHHGAVFKFLSFAGRDRSSERAVEGASRDAGTSIIFIVALLLLVALAAVFLMLVAYRAKRSELAQSAADRRGNSQVGAQHAPKVFDASSTSTTRVPKHEGGPAHQHVRPPPAAQPMPTSQPMSTQQLTAAPPVSTQQLPLKPPMTSTPLAEAQAPPMPTQQITAAPAPQPAAPWPPFTATPERTTSMAEAECLCEELLVPEGHECVLAVPSVLGLPLGAEPYMLQIVDKVGGPLISVALHRGVQQEPATGSPVEHMRLTSRGSADLALCTVKPRPRGGGMPQAMLFWPSGDLYGQLDEVVRRGDSFESNATLESEGSGLRAVPTGERHFVLAPGAAGPGAPIQLWQLVVTLEIASNKMTVTNETTGLPPRTVAAMSSGNLFNFNHPGNLEYNELRVASLTDTSVMILLCLAIHRMLNDGPAA